MRNLIIYKNAFYQTTCSSITWLFALEVVRANNKRNIKAARWLLFVLGFQRCPVHTMGQQYWKCVSIMPSLRGHTVQNSVSNPCMPIATTVYLLVANSASEFSINVADGPLCICLYRIYTHRFFATVRIDWLNWGIPQHLTRQKTRTQETQIKHTWNRI